ncbi:hypothetical protein [Kitasatospora sp. NPDC088783]|uniref:hypothetical protein n=1 Tax=Kitasatospora sp. NPDC088783 TaxID=3364077 RepID=UPI003810A6FC
MERECGLDLLRADGSWRFTWSRGFVDKAVFRLAPDPGRRRRVLAERLLTERLLAERLLTERLLTERSPTGPFGGGEVDPADPEQWEGVLVDALLSHPAARLLRGPELHLTDYHHSAERAAVALGRRRWPRLASLSFGHGFDTLLESHTTSAGNSVVPEAYLNAAVVPEAVARALWGSLPALRSLELEGAFLFDDVEHDGLAHLRVRGSVFADGSLFPSATPALVSLEVEIDCDVHGTMGTNAQLAEPAPARYPRLRSLDLGGAHFEPEEAGDFVLLAEHPLLAQLEHLDIRELVIGAADADGDLDPPALLAALAPRFAHLELRVAGDVDVEGADDEEVARMLPALGTVPAP